MPTYIAFLHATEVSGLPQLQLACTPFICSTAVSCLPLWLARPYCLASGPAWRTIDADGATVVPDVRTKHGAEQSTTHFVRNAGTGHRCATDEPEIEAVGDDSRLRLQTPSQTLASS